MNYVKTKLKLEMMDAGEQLEVWLDAGEPIKNVPMSLKNDGHKLLLQEPLEAAAASLSDSGRKSGVSQRAAQDRSLLAERAR